MNSTRSPIRGDANEMPGISLSDHGSNLLYQASDVTLAVAGCEQPVQLVQGPLQVCGSNRLQQIVNRIDLECLECVLIERGCKDDQGLRFAKLLQQFEAGHAWHLDIQEQHIGTECSDVCQGVGGVIALADNIHAVMFFKKASKAR